MPKGSSTSIVSTLGATAKIESSDTVLSAGRLTTEKLVSYIKDYSRLRDELLHTIRQLGLTRIARTASTQPSEYASYFARARDELDQKKAEYQEIQSRIDGLEKQIEEAKKQASRIAEIIQAGFSSTDLAFGKGEFNRVLGRIPARKLVDAQRALEKLLGGHAVLATGNRVGDHVYVLLAAPEEKMQQSTQTLLLYDFAPSEIAKLDEPDINTAKTILETKIMKLSSELDQAKMELKEFQAQASESLNRLADGVQDSLMHMQGVLRIGEGAQASKVFAWLTKPPSPRTLSSLSSQGVLYETE